MTAHFLLAGLVWNPWDTTIVIAGALAAMACSLPGIWLVLRRQSMMGDALSHTALPGVVIAVLASHYLSRTFDIFPSTSAAEPLLLLVGAILIGVLTAMMTEWVQKLGRVESSAALGVVYTSLFALGLLLLRLQADHVDLDLDCVLFGQLELIVFRVTELFGVIIPQPFVVNGALLLGNLLLISLFYKELRIVAFDSDQATVQGFRSQLINYGLMVVTAVTVVLAFESVGSILVIGLLIVPAATALLLTDRLIMIHVISLLVASASAVVGHLMAKTLPAMIFQPLGFPDVVDAGTSGMIAVACGLFFLAAFFFSPRYGFVGKGLSRIRLRMQIAADDILSVLFRFEEQLGNAPVKSQQLERETVSISRPEQWLALFNLKRDGLITREQDLLSLTSGGRSRATQLISAHRLFESYMEKHFDLPSDHLHETAHVVEHYLDEEMRSQLKDELDSPDVDPHGRRIPHEQ